MDDLISRREAEDIVRFECGEWTGLAETIVKRFEALPSAQPEIVRCKDCKYGEQDEVGRWFCRSLGCQVGEADGSGFCADAEMRTDD